MRRGSPVIIAVALAVALGACSGRSVRHVAGSSGAGGSAPGHAGEGASTSSSSGGGGEAATPECDYASIARLCVLGEADGDAQRLTPGAPVRVQVTPSRCVSSACTDTVINVASIRASDDAEAGRFVVDALLCFAPRDPVLDRSCESPCETFNRRVTSDLTLIEGTNVVTLGGLEVTFVAPSTVPNDELCAGLSF